MKRTLFALLFLLFLLIIACVYQKTYTLYSIQTTQEQEPAVVIHEERENTIEKKDMHTVVSDTTKKKEQVIPQTISKTDIATVAPTSTEEKPKESSLLEQIKSTVTQTFTPAQDVAKKETVVVVEKVISHTPEISKKEMQQVEDDAVDYLLTVLKEHKDALGERDAAESRLHAMIEKVLEDRKKAIANMEDVAALSKKAQATRIEKRDQTSQKIIENNTKGE